MATSKQAESAQTEALVADEYLSDLVYQALLERGEPSKVSEITLEINNPRIMFPVVRRLVTDSPRFLTIDRQWDLTARYLDRSRPTERNLSEVLKAAGKPLSTIEMATELSIIYARGSEVYSQLLGKILQNKNTYFKTRGGSYGLISWLPLVDAEEEEDLLFDNEVTEAQLKPLRETAGVTWSSTSYADATLALANALKGRPLTHKVVGVLAWLALKGKYDPLKHLQDCLADERLVWLSSPGGSGGRWISRAHADRLESELEERGAALAGEDTSEEPPAAAAPVIEEAMPALDADSLLEEAAREEAEIAVEEPPAPLQVKDEDLAAIERILADRGAPIDAVELLALQYEVVAGDPSFRADVQTLEERLKSDDRFLSVGAGRFREPNSLPLFVYSLPEFLAFPDLQFVSMDGEIMDEEIEDEGFVGVLRQELLDPLAQDAGDDEGRYTGPAVEDASRARCVVKAHHKDIGTFPVCQIPDGFFPTDAPVVEVIVRAPNGESHDIIVNNDLRLAFNFFGLYEFISADSGGVFFLTRSVGRPYEYRFEPVEENDPQVYVAPPRIAELMALREQAEGGGDLATFDITCEVLAHYPKGMTLVQMMTEVNLVRRVTRRKLASILSNYYCFQQKAGTDQWRFDPRKRDLGTDRAKRKYIKR